MTKRAYSYPDDEFDTPLVDPAHDGAADETRDLDEAHGGAHRRKRSGWRLFWQFVIVALIGALLAYLAVTFVPKFANTTSSELVSKIGVTTSAATGNDSTTSGGDASPADPPAGDGTATDGATGGATDATTPDKTTPDKSTPDKPAKTATPKADLSTSVRVLNATRTAGLAAQGVGILKDAGWQQVAAANYSGSAVSGSVVYYKTDADLVNANAVAKDLGISRISQSATLSAPVVAILAADFSG